MVSELLVAIALSGAVLGAVANTIKGYWAPDAGNYSFKKLGSALLSSGFFAFGIVNIAQLPDQLESYGYIGLFFLNAVLGWGIDSIHSALDA